MVLMDFDFARPLPLQNYFAITNVSTYFLNHKTNASIFKDV